MENYVRAMKGVQGRSRQTKRSRSVSQGPPAPHVTLSSSRVGGAWGELPKCILTLVAEIESRDAVHTPPVDVAVESGRRSALLPQVIRRPGRGNAPIHSPGRQLVVTPDDEEVRNLRAVVGDLRHRTECLTYDIQLAEKRLMELRHRVGGDGPQPPGFFREKFESVKAKYDRLLEELDQDGRRIHISMAALRQVDDAERVEGVGGSARG